MSRNIIRESNLNLSDFENSKFLDFQNRISVGALAALPQRDPGLIRLLRLVLLVASSSVKWSPST